jgi:hypothetical protein
LWGLDSCLLFGWDEVDRKGYQEYLVIVFEFELLTCL